MWCVYCTTLPYTTHTTVHYTTLHYTTLSAWCGEKKKKKNETCGSMCHYTPSGDSLMYINGKAVRVHHFIQKRGALYVSPRKPSADQGTIPCGSGFTVVDNEATSHVRYYLATALDTPEEHFPSNNALAKFWSRVGVFSPYCTSPNHSSVLCCGHRTMQWCCVVFCSGSSTVHYTTPTYTYIHQTHTPLSHKRNQPPVNTPTSAPTLVASLEVLVVLYSV